MIDLYEYFDKYDYTKKDLFVKKEIPADDITLSKIRDCLYKIGSILEVDEKQKVYVANIKPNKLSGKVFIVFKLTDDKLYIQGYCATDTKNQNTVHKAIELFKDTLKNKPLPKKSKLLPILIGLSIVVVVAFICLSINAFGTMQATNNYNSKVKAFNKTVDEYNSLAKKGDLSSISDMPTKIDNLSYQNSDFFSAIGVFFSSNNKDKINKDANTVVNMTQDNNDAIKVIKQIEAPSQKFVISKLKKVDSISKIEAVTEKTDVNKLIGKKGGYYSCMYFSTNLLDNKKISGNTIIEKGTDGGGAVELYKDLKSAQERCKYLDSFDDSIVNTGSYVLVGTMVIRTSYKLDSTEQYNLTESIIKQLTTVE